MKPKTKSFLALTGTLVIGLVIGSLVTLTVIRQRINDFKDLRQPKNFKTHLLKAADATPEQEAQIEPLIERFGEQLHQLHQAHGAAISANFDSLKEGLTPILDDRQMKRVNRKIKRMQGRMKKGPYKNGPPGPRNRNQKRDRNRPH